MPRVKSERRPELVFNSDTFSDYLVQLGFHVIGPPHSSPTAISTVVLVRPRCLRCERNDRDCERRITTRVLRDESEDDRSRVSAIACVRCSEGKAACDRARGKGAYCRVAIGGILVSVCLSLRWVSAWVLMGVF